MKLDFSALTQPASKERGQVGTTGTQVSMRVAASPTAGDTPGTRGDTARRVRPGLDLSATVPAVCPAPSPPCPQSLGACKPNVHGVSPVSQVVPTELGNCAARTGVAEWTCTVPESKTAVTPARDRTVIAGTVETVAYTRKAEKDASALPDLAMEARRQRVLAMLGERPGVRYALLTDTKADQNAVILALAIRDVGTCELRVPRVKFDPFVLLDLIAQHGVRR